MVVSSPLPTEVVTGPFSTYTPLKYQSSGIWLVTIRRTPKCQSAELVDVEAAMFWTTLVSGAESVEVQRPLVDKENCNRRSEKKWLAGMRRLWKEEFQPTGFIVYAYTRDRIDRLSVRSIISSFWLTVWMTRFHCGKTHTINKLRFACGKYGCLFHHQKPFVFCMSWWTW